MQISGFLNVLERAVTESFPNQGGPSGTGGMQDVDEADVDRLIAMVQACGIRVSEGVVRYSLGA